MGRQEGGGGREFLALRKAAEGDEEGRGAVPAREPG